MSNKTTFVKYIKDRFYNDLFSAVNGYVKKYYRGLGINPFIRTMASVLTAFEML